MKKFSNENVFLNSIGDLTRQAYTSDTRNTPLNNAKSITRFESDIFINKKEVVIVNQSNIQTVNFDVKGMTCASCEQHITHAVNELEGIVNVNASYEKANAKVEFDNSKTTKEDIEKAINSTGYKVTYKEEN